MRPMLQRTASTAPQPKGAMEKKGGPLMAREQPGTKGDNAIGSRGGRNADPAGWYPSEGGRLGGSGGQARQAAGRGCHSDLIKYDDHIK